MTTARQAPEARTASIMAVARELLREVGYEHFLPSEVARRCGISEGLVYRYFPTKRHLLNRVAEDWFEDILSLEPELEHVHGSYARLRYVIAHDLEVVRKEPALTRYLCLELRPAAGYRGSRAQELNRRFTSIVQQVITEGIAAGDFRSDVDPRLVRDMVFGAIEYRTWGFLRGESPFPLHETADQITDLIYRSITAR
ncbi:TetR/AcrR family transcriptional regulator [Sporichthya sp.]|uniref:TetR/AcrR family transcriptional regulator n=1 Tax=Sporichthya sp. TaxID=65475 RepID=UPI001849A513|nr:TetR/AcrR family transcriptional regulator [Sporichthya sp.]MBA3742513.1 TetR/AcrR family transcriptional regulator [Sporichthya sp.]